MYAPDCVRGKDGRYYLYYCLSGDNGKGCYFGPVSVAVCDTPDGKYEFYGHVKFADGTPCTKYVPFDPAVINDDGVIRLYYGTCYPFDELPKIAQPIMRKMESGMFGKTVKEIKAEKGGVMGAITCVLSDDMLTIKEPPSAYFPLKRRVRRLNVKQISLQKTDTGFRGTAFMKAHQSEKLTANIILSILR